MGHKINKICHGKTKKGKVCGKVFHTNKRFCKFHQNRYEMAQKKINYRKSLTPNYKPKFEGEHTVDGKDYYEYLKSDEWKEKAAKKRKKILTVVCAIKKVYFTHTIELMLGVEAKDRLTLLFCALIVTKCSMISMSTHRTLDVL